MIPDVVAGFSPRSSFVAQGLHWLKFRSGGRRVEGGEKADQNRHSGNNCRVERLRLEGNVSDRVDVRRQADKVIFVREVACDLAYDNSERRPDHADDNALKNEDAADIVP